MVDEVADGGGVPGGLAGEGERVGSFVREEELKPAAAKVSTLGVEEGRGAETT